MLLCILLCRWCVFLVSLVRFFLGFISLRGVLPLGVRYIVRLLLVLSTFVLGGGGSVAIKRYIRLLWATVVGMCMFYLWFTVGGLRSPGNRVTP